MYQRQQSQQQSQPQPSQPQPSQPQPSQPQAPPPRKKGTPFCKVCFDAGKSDKEYTSHYLRSAPGPDGKLVCPTLLNQSCLTCGHRGHTSSYCDKRDKRDQDKRNQDKRDQDKRNQDKRDQDKRDQDKRDQDKCQDQAQVQTKRIDATPMSAEAELRRLTATFRNPEEPSHYNPKSNPFGALNEQIPKPMTIPKPMMPMTMAEKLKSQSNVPKKYTPITPTTTKDVRPLLKPEFPGMPPKSQFWWQDE